MVLFTLFITVSICVAASDYNGGAYNNKASLKKSADYLNKLDNKNKEKFAAESANSASASA